MEERGKLKSYDCARDYSDKTLKLLFGLSGNRCAHPECRNRIIEHATLWDPEAVVAEICHIYGIKSTSPRPYPFPFDDKGELQKLLNDFDNLVLLCRHHHKIADAQENTYTVEQLSQWKKNHLNKVLETRSSFINKENENIKILLTEFSVNKY
jgi:hypothetical protein